jgi:glycerol-3-phosphate dehydrogenase (NAD(P)+)
MSGQSTRRIGVVGLGNWGTALAHCLSQRHGSVIAWTKDPAVRDMLRTTRCNSMYQIVEPLHDGITIVDRLEDMKVVDVVILAIPSRYFAEVASSLSSLSPSVVLVSASKGLDPATCRTPLQVLEQSLPAHHRRVVISGPSFSADVLRGLPAAMVAGATNQDDARLVAELFVGTPLRVYTSDDPLGVELGGILKNVIAIAAGVSDGLGLGDSSRAAVITRGLAEMRPFCAAAGAKAETLFGLSGLGDLIMTATSSLSRNRTVGFRLGQGETLTAIIESLGSVAEGVQTIERVLELSSRYHLSMPITEQMQLIISGKTTPSEALQNLLRRPSRAEFGG